MKKKKLTKLELLACHEAFCYISSRGMWIDFIGFLKRNKGYGSIIEAIGMQEHGADIIGKLYDVKHQD